MNQRQRILELVKNDTITVEQGMELMSALETRDETPNRPPSPPMPPAPPAWKTSASSVKVGRPLATGSGQLSFDQIVQLGIHGVKPSYIEELRKAGLEDVPFNDLTKLIVHRIPVSYVLELRNMLVEHGFEPLNVDQIVKLGIHKIQPSYVLELLKTGAFNLNAPAAQNTDLDERRAKLGVKLSKVDAKLERATTGAQRQKLTELREELTDELEKLDADVTDALEVEVGAELPAELGMREPRAAVQQWFEIKHFADSRLPIAAQKLALEEMMQDISADIGVATDAAERAALLDVHAQISAELSQLNAQ